MSYRRSRTDDTLRDVAARVETDAELAARAALGESDADARYSNEARESRGVLCPNCGRFSPRCVKRWFPKGEQAALREWIRRGALRKVAIAGVSAGVVGLGAFVSGPLWGSLICAGVAVAGWLVARNVWSSAKSLIALIEPLSAAQVHQWLCGAYERMGGVIDPRGFLGLLRDEGLAMAFAPAAQASAAPEGSARQAGPGAPPAPVAADPAPPREGDDRPGGGSASPSPRSGSPASSEWSQGESVVPPEALAAAQRSSDVDELHRLIDDFQDRPGWQVDEVLTAILLRSDDFGERDPRIRALAALRSRKKKTGERIDIDPLLCVIERHLRGMRTMAGPSPEHFARLVRLAGSRLFSDCVDAVAHASPLACAAAPKDAVRRLRGLLETVQVIQRRFDDTRAIDPQAAQLAAQLAPRKGPESDLTMPAALKMEFLARFKALERRLEKDLLDARREVRRQAEQEPAG